MMDYRISIVLLFFFIIVIIVIIFALWSWFSGKKIKPEKIDIAARDQPLIKEEGQLLKCPYCEAEVIKDDSFCGNCGKRLKS